MVTLQDIADRCGLHKSTVQRALSGTGRINPETAEKIRALSAELGYDPAAHDAARRMAFRKHNKKYLNRTIGLLFPNNFAEINHFLFLFQGIMEVMNEEQYDLLTLANHTPVDIPHTVTHGGIDGAIVFGPVSQVSQRLERFRMLPTFQQRPVVSLFYEIPTCSLVTPDYRHGAYLAADHLLALGHRRILLEGFTTEMKFAGYRQACLDRGLNAGEILLAAPTFNHPDRSERVVGSLRLALKQYSNFTAILAANDVEAVIIGDALRQFGLRIPDDISLVGFDDTDSLHDAQGRNMLTTVNISVREMGRQAARLLIDRIADRIADDTNIVLPTALVTRQSTAVPTRV